MTDPYWDELGFAWTAAAPDPQTAEPRLKSRLHRQAMGLRLLVLGASLASLAGLALGAWTLWIGWSAHVWHFLVRGSAVVILAGLAGWGAASLAGGVRDDTRSLAQAVDLSISRAERSLRALWLGLAGCGIAAALGLAGFWLRAAHGRPALMSPVEPLAFLALLMTVFWLLQRSVSDDLERSRHVRRLLEAD
jgi:hypothetical protein